MTAQPTRQPTGQPSTNATQAGLFFCTGFHKSGTTWLQALLDRHPAIACAPEQDLPMLAQELEEAVKKYNLRAVELDRRTGGPGRPAFVTASFTRLFRGAVHAALQEYAQGKPVIGAKDNTLLLRLDAFGALFPMARFFCVFRNPLDRAISAWHHNQRLAKKENDPRHVEMMMEHGGLEGWSRRACSVLGPHLEAFRRNGLPRDRLLVLRYEDLVADPLPQLRRILSFLGLPEDENAMAHMLKETSLERMRERAADPGFFRSAATQAAKGELPDKLRLELAAGCADALRSLGYRVTPEGLELLPMEAA